MSAARYPELTDKRPTVFEMKENTTVLKKYVGRSELGAESAERYGEC